MEVYKFLNQLDHLVKQENFKPHRYLLLLTIIDLINQGYDNKIYYDSKLKEVFTYYFEKFGSVNDRNRPYTPFFHLKNSGFWHLKPRSGKEIVLESVRKVGGPIELNELVEYGYLDQEIYELLKAKSKEIKNYIVELLKSSNVNETANIIKEKESSYLVAMNESLFSHEENAIRSIIKQLNSYGKILTNIYLYDEQSRLHYELDMIFIARSGIYIIELKHWSGNIQVCNNSWIYNQVNYRRNPHIVNNQKCKLLKGICEKHFWNYHIKWVESIVVLTNTNAEISGCDTPVIALDQKKHNFTFSSISDFVLFIKKKDNENRIYDQIQINCISDYIKGLNNPNTNLKYQIPGYETVEYLSQKKECIELLARSTQGRHKGLMRFRIFRPPLYDNVLEKQRFLRRAYNTLDSVVEIGDHPNIQKVMIIPNDEGDIIEGSEWSETGTLRDYIQSINQKTDIKYTMEICLGIAKALQRSHEAGIIHRAVKPENILMVNGIPKLMNFDLAYQLEEDRITVISDLSRLRDDGYIAPEVLGGEDIDEGTDYFALGVIAYELLAGKKPFASTRAFKAQGGILRKEDLKLLEQKEIPTQIIKLLQSLIIADRNIRQKNPEHILSLFDLQQKEKSFPDQEINRKLPPGARYDLFEIQEYLGKGAEAQIYKANTMRQRIVALKLYNKEIPWEKIQKEAGIAAAIKSSYVVNCDWKLGHWDKDRFFMVMDYIQGKTIRKYIEEGKKPNIAVFQTITQGLIEGVKAFHTHQDEEYNLCPLIHGDIKPDNIILTDDEKPVLIDFGLAGEPRVEIFQGTVGYVPPDSIMGTERQYSEDSDIFALGVTLWEWLFGEKPYESPSVTDRPSLPDHAQYLDDRLKRWLMKAVATRREERFSSIEEMKAEFNSCFKERTEEKEIYGEPIVDQEEISADQGVIASTFSGNSFVAYLNTLNNSSAGNENALAESQVRNSFFSKIMIDNPFLEYIQELLISKRQNVILTGNAGDGKTTIALELVQKVSGAMKELARIEVLPEVGITIVKDMSELTETEQRKVLEDALTNTSMKYLIISNTGTLINSFNTITNQNREIEKELLKKLEENSPQEIMNGRLMIINIGRINSIDTVLKVFRRILEPDNWSACLACECYNECAIIANIKHIQANLDTVCERISLLYYRLYAYGVRLTMRQMIGHLAYAITGGQDFHNIIGRSQIARKRAMIEYAFINLFFGDNGVIAYPEAAQHFPIQRIQKEKFGTILDPCFEREIMLKQTANDLPQDTRPLLTEIEKLKLINLTPYDIRRQKRRLYYFFATFNNQNNPSFLTNFLQSPMLIEFRKYCTDSKINGIKERSLRYKVLHVLQEFFLGIRLPEQGWKQRDIFLTLANSKGGSGTQVILATLRADDFKISAEVKFRIGTQKYFSLYLYYKNQVKLELDLPFLDYVLRRRDGELVQDLSAYFINRLKKFKIELLEAQAKTKKDTLELIQVKPDRKLSKLEVAVHNGKLEVLA